MKFKKAFTVVLMVIISLTFGVMSVSAQLGSDNSLDNVDPFPSGVGDFDDIGNVGTPNNTTPTNPGQPGTGNPRSSCKNINDFPGVVTCITGMVNITIPLIIGLAAFLFLWGLIKYITAGGDDKATEEARKFMLFGIIALFVMVSVWGLVGILVNTFFSGGVAIPQLK